MDKNGKKLGQIVIKLRNIHNFKLVSKNLSNGLVLYTSICPWKYSYLRKRKMFRSSFDSENNTWSGRDVKPPFNPNISIGQAVLWILEKNPNKIAQVAWN